jgi:hypothetical protein
LAKPRDLADLLDKILPCRQVDPEEVFAEEPHRIEKAKERCTPCPVRIQCLREGLQPHNIEYGVWGGTTPEERAELLNPTTKEEAS